MPDKPDVDREDPNNAVSDDKEVLCNLGLETLLELRGSLVQPIRGKFGVLDRGPLGLFDGVSQVNFSGRRLDHGGVAETALLILSLLKGFSPWPCLPFVCGEGDAQFVAAFLRIVQSHNPTAISENRHGKAASRIWKIRVGCNRPRLTLITGGARDYSMGWNARVPHEGENRPVLATS